MGLSRRLGAGGAATVTVLRLPSLAVLLAVALVVGAGAPAGVRVDNWERYAAGPLNLSDVWRQYPSPRTFKYAPAIVLDGGRPVLAMQTEDESMRIGRAIKVNPRKTPWLTWEWKTLALPDGGDVRNPRRNDQAGRLMVAFEGMKGLFYLWDTTAPVGVELQPEDFEIFRRVLIVVRSGPERVGRWERQRRNVHADYRRVFGEEPREIKWVGLETHSNDTHSRTAVLFGGVRFDAR